MLTQGKSPPHYKGGILEDPTWCFAGELVLCPGNIWCWVMEQVCPEVARMPQAVFRPLDHPRPWPRSDSTLDNYILRSPGELCPHAWGLWLCKLLSCRYGLVCYCLCLQFMLGHPEIDLSMMCTCSQEPGSGLWWRTTIKPPHLGDHPPSPAGHVIPSHFYTCCLHWLLKGSVQ